MNVKVIAGFVLNPIKKKLNPTILGESDSSNIKMDRVANAHATLIANFLPELSAIYGITKKPNNAPINSIDCITETILSLS